MYMRRGKNNDDGWGTVYQGLAFLGNAMRQGQAIGTERRRRDEEDGLNNAYNYIAGKIGNQGDVSLLDSDPILNTRQGTQALGMFMTDRANTETSRLKMLKTMDAANDHYYQNTIRPLAFAAQEAFKAGDLQRFGQVAGELSSKAPYPYRLIPGQDGNFDVEFRSDQAGGWSRTGERVAPQQVMGEIDKLMAGEQQILAGANMQARPVNQRYLASAARYQMGTILGNAQNMANPQSWIPLQKGNKVVYAIPQNRHDNYEVGPSFRVLEEGKASFMTENLDELVKQGYQPVIRSGKNRASIGLIGTGRNRTSANARESKEGKQAFHQLMLQSGYGYDKDQKWYFRAKGTSENGKLLLDYASPVSGEEVNAARAKLAGKRSVFPQSADRSVASSQNPGSGISGKMQKEINELSVMEDGYGRKKRDPFMAESLSNLVSRGMSVNRALMQYETLLEDAVAKALKNNPGIPEYTIRDAAKRELLNRLASPEPPASSARQ